MSQERPEKKENLSFSQAEEIPRSPKLSSHHNQAPIHLYDAERQKRLHQRQERKMMLSVLVSLVFIVGLFYVLNQMFGKGQSEETVLSEKQQNLWYPAKEEEGDTATASETSQSSTTSLSDTSDRVAMESQKQTQAAASQVSEESHAEDISLLAGTAMPNANTGDVIQEAKGTGKNHNAAAGVYAYPIAQVKEAMFGGEDLPAGRMAFLTFDDGIDTESTPLLLDTLQEIGVPATFFMVGQSFTESNRGILERAWQEGHAIGFHSFDHEYEKLYPDRRGDADEIFSQYEKSKDALQSLLGSSVEVKAFRYPGGHMSWDSLDEADARLSEAGVDWMDWNAMTGDAEPDAPTTIDGEVQEVLDTWALYGYPNTITILMHDGIRKSLTRESLSSIVDALREEGFSFGILE